MTQQTILIATADEQQREFIAEQFDVSASPSMTLTASRARSPRCLRTRSTS